MRAVYIGGYSATGERRFAIAAVSMPILERKRIKNDFKEITRETVSFSNVTYDNVKMLYLFCKQFIKESNLSSSVYHIADFHRSQYCNILFNFAVAEFNRYNEPVRVYIPYEKDKTFLKTLNKMAIKRNLQIYFEEIRLDESCFQQLAGLLAGCVFYRRDDEKYFDCLGVTPEAQLTAYVYSSKKEKDKLNIKDYIPAKRKK